MIHRAALCRTDFEPGKMEPSLGNILLYSLDDAILQNPEFPAQSPE